MRHGNLFIYKLLLPKAILLCGLLLTHVKLNAQTDTTKKLQEVSIKASPAPKIQILTPAQQVNNGNFSRYSAFTVADAIRNFAGVNIKDYGGIGGLKTISVRSLGANHTAVLFDGVQLTDAQSGQIDLSKFNLNNVQEIALYNGQPADILQPARSYASASVLSIKSIQPLLSRQKPYQVQAGVKTGSFGLVNPYLQWQQRISNKWSFIGNSNFINANGRYKYKVDGDGSDSLAIRHNGDIRSIQTDAAVYWVKNDSNKFSIRFNYYNAGRGLPGAVIFYNATTGQRLNNNDLFVQASYRRTWQNGLQLLLNSKLAGLKTRYYDPNTLNQQGYINEHYSQREVYQSVALAYQLTKSWQISYAADVSYAKVDADIYNYAYPARLTLLNVLASNYKIGKWQLQGNLLQTNIHESVERGLASKTRQVLTPTLMASFTPFEQPDLQLRAFYKNICRAPTLDELYYFALFPRTIKPEFVNQYNVGAVYTKNTNNLLEYITLSTDIYYNTITDKILAVPNQNPVIFSYSNIGRVDVKGIDIGIKTQTRQQSGWRGLLSANYTNQQALDVTNPASSTYLGQIPYTPKHTLALNAGATYNDLGIYFNHILSSPRYYTGNNLPEYYVPGYSVSDASAVYKFITSRMPVQASVEINNLFNNNYSIIRSFPMPGRSYRLSFQITI
jgi:vitamin B12 transporter